MTSKYKDNADVVFGEVAAWGGGPNGRVDVILGEKQDMGKDGFPTIRAFSKKIGYAGKTYTRKTDQAMHEELGPGNDNLQMFIQDTITDNARGIGEILGDWLERLKNFFGWRSDTGDAQQCSAGTKVYTCSILDTSSGCSSEEKAFMQTWMGKKAEEKIDMLFELEGKWGQQSSGLAEAERKWLEQRMKIIQQIVEKARADGNW